MDARSPLHARNPECIEAIAELHAEVQEFRSWQSRQNGSLDRMAEQMSHMRVTVGIMDEKLSVLIARQAEDRDAVAKLREVHDSGPLPKDTLAAKPPEQQLDAAARVLGLPLWKALLYALLLGGALAGGGKGTGAVLERFFPSAQQAQTTTTTQTGR